MKAKFERYVDEGLRHYSRFADNIVIQHEDKTFLHIVTEMAIMVLARDYYIDVNKDWNVRPVHNGGIDVCGYVSLKSKLVSLTHKLRTACLELELQSRLQKRMLRSKSLTVAIASI